MVESPQNLFVLAFFEEERPEEKEESVERGSLLPKTDRGETGVYWHFACNTRDAAELRC